MDDYYCVEEPSDNEQCESSDDEDFRRLFNLLQSDDSEDDFETEMDKERDKHAKTLENVTSTSTTADDDLFYDPQSDEQDQKWIDDQRRLSRAPEEQRTSGRTSQTSDATLNCPCCMSLLCLDCQRHEIYKTQYRAMFVFNCQVDFSQRLQFKSKSKRHKKTLGSSDNNQEAYLAVKCSLCNTQVAVYDNEEVYHFFNVLASFS